MNARKWACFECRKVWKRDETQPRPAGCPECGGTLTFMGYRWRAPKRSNRKAWKSARLQRYRGSADRIRTG